MSDWTWDPRVRKYCCYIEAQQCVFYQDGGRVACTVLEWRQLQRNGQMGTPQPRNMPSSSGGPTGGRSRAQSGSFNGLPRPNQTLTSPGRPGVVPLDRTYRPHPSNWFRRYRVLKILWHEHAGDDSATFNSAISRDRRHGERIFSEIRWLVVIGSTNSHSLCLPIMTYQYQGVAKPTAHPPHHAIVYTTDEPPQPSPEEQAAERLRGRMRTPIRVSPDDPTTQLDPMSRLDYSRIYTVQHNVKVKAFGHIKLQFRPAFDRDRGAVYRDIALLNLGAAGMEDTVML